MQAQDGTDSFSAQDVVQDLLEAGFSEYEAQAYLTLLRLGRGNGRTVSQTTRVPFSKVYSVLRSLEEKGLVVREEGRPALYRPLDPREAMEMLRRRRVMEETAKLDALGKKLSRLMTRDFSEEKALVSVVRDQQTVISRTLAMIRGASFGIKAVVPPLEKGQKEALSLLIQGLATSGLKLQVLLKKGYEVGELGASVDVRTISTVPLGLIIIDSKAVTVLLYVGGITGLLTDSPALVELAELVFERLWEVAEPSAEAYRRRRPAFFLQLPCRAFAPADV
ncbi:MAG: TrmB family transcriptional regulator [Thermoprotei archaeon]|nr:helix-turn-helix domain-containing protein [TACK group archaeon]